MIKIGILSDTHISQITPVFLKNAKQAFADCSIIIHAGDLTDIAILEVFKGKQVFAVAGNICNYRTKLSLPEITSFSIDGKLFALCHGANGPRHNIEERLFDIYPEADCIVYGHTHHAVCKQIAHTLYINPGSFTGTGTYGAPGTYAIAELSEGKITAKIMELN
ncbi:MAG: metallophosphatase family protein [Desulfotalea sp.]